LENKKKLITQVLDRIEQVSRDASKYSDNITLIAVSKTKPVEDIIEAYKAGIRNFGENRADELAEKANKLKHLKDLKWHFIGHLQTRKSKLVAENAHSFHAVDRLKIARRLSNQLQELKRTLPVFIEINISGEKSKGGFNCEDWENNQDQRDQLLEAIKIISDLPALSVRGLMTMAPYQADTYFIRSVFKRLRELSEWINEKLPELRAHDLSMGMSGDFEIAVEEGATHVRIGSAIFGKR